MFPKQGRKIALVGSSGNVGRPTLSSLLAQDIHTITVIQRPDSTALYPANVTVKRGSFYDEAFLVDAVSGQDVLVLQLPRTATDIRPGLIRAAAKANVKYVLPVEFGTSPDAEIVEHFDNLLEKRKSRKLVEELGVSSWIAVVTNPWLDLGLLANGWGIRIEERKATLWEGGNTKINTSTLKRSGDATAKLLSLPDSELDKFRNRPFFVSSCYVSQRQIFESVMRATTTDEKDWIVTTPTVEDVVRESQEALKAGDFMKSFLDKYYMTHFRKGFGGDYNNRIDSTNLGFPEEDLDKIVEEILSSGRSS
ncbi:hypothetical protein NLG97_g2221 [Lecanicillium saksenae]|uniref:Uncharacterized protein n=1 Tax=Lecanicillium saksenae TaxID=468837 RepID=A0ACC1R3D2_9HYPO|nr:hypothetical protein NLG97_g2221 [Lecanicillium saksenae]